MKLNRELLVDYIKQCSTEFQLYKEIQTYPYISNFRCFICGDSVKKKNKKRAYILEKDNNFIYYCHNCGYSNNFLFFLKDYFPILHKEYFYKLFSGDDDINEKLKLNTTFKNKTTSDSENDNLKIDLGISFFQYEKEKKSDLIISYLQKRKVPMKYWNDIFISNIHHITEQLNYKKFDFNQECIIFPLFINKNDYSYLVLRLLSENRYLTLKINDKHPKLWGLKYLNKDDKTSFIFLVEGIFDAISIDNGIAICGINNIRKGIDYCISTGIDENKIVVCFDNEYSNKDLLREYDYCISNKIKVVIFDKSFKYKDLNEALQNNISKEELNHILFNRIFYDLQAKLELSKFSKHRG